jgi:hypothetical protein
MHSSFRAQPRIDKHGAARKKHPEAGMSQGGSGQHTAPGRFVSIPEGIGRTHVIGLSPCEEREGISPPRSMRRCRYLPDAQPRKIRSRK